MLHMVVITHGPDTCAGAHPESGVLARDAFGQIDAKAAEHGVSIQARWVDVVGHTFYIVADAPSAHVVSVLMIELRLYHWNTVDVHPIVTLEEGLALTK